MTDDTEKFEQLSLEPTITGPGQRTEDPFEPGTKVKVEGQRGVFVYRYATVSKAGLVSLHLTQDGAFRAVRPDQVTMVRKPRWKRLSGPSKDFSAWSEHEAHKKSTSTRPVRAKREPVFNVT